MTSPPSLLVSACLLGEPCRYDGASKGHAAVQRACARAQEQGAHVVPVCPEAMGGLPTPRPAADLRGGDGHAALDGRGTVATVRDDTDVTEAFVAGARAAFAQAPHARWAILKARSPSCGTGATHIEGRAQQGDGVFSALLQRAGVTRCTEEDPLDALRFGDEAP